MQRQATSRRQFLKLGVAGSAVIASVGLGREVGAAEDELLPQGIDLEKWKRLKAPPYAVGATPMPGGLPVARTPRQA